MTNSSSLQKDDETKPVLGHEYSQSHQNFHAYPGYYGQPYFNYNNTNDDNNNNNNPSIIPPSLYFYSHFQPNYNNTPHAQLSDESSPPPPRKLFTCCRVLFCLIVIIILGVVTLFVVFYFKVYLRYKVIEPGIRVVSFDVRKFEISNTSKLRADWEIDMNTWNFNKKTNIRVEHVANSLSYRYAIIDTTFSAPFQLNRNSDAYFRAEFDIPNSNHKRMGGLVVKEMVRDRKVNRYLRFDLFVEVKFSSRIDGKTLRNTYKYTCEDLKLEFKDSSGLPKWDGHVVECDVDDD